MPCFFALMSAPRLKRPAAGAIVGAQCFRFAHGIPVFVIVVIVGIGIDAFRVHPADGCAHRLDRRGAADKVAFVVVPQNQAAPGVGSLLKMRKNAWSSRLQ